MHNRKTSLQAAYFSKVKYRDPYDPVVTAYAEPKMNFIRDTVPLRGRILDVGCGNGIFTSRLANADTNVIGLDFSRHLLAQNPHRSLICGDALTLPFRDRTFDVVFEANLLHHVADRDRAIQELRRVSRKYVVLLEPNRYNPLMFAFSLIVPAEHGGLRSCVTRLRREITLAGMEMAASLTCGMISQTNTPRALVPALKRFDRAIWWGEYIVAIAQRID